MAAEFGAALGGDAGNSRNDVAVSNVQLGLLQLGLGGFLVGDLGAKIGLLDGDLPGRIFLSLLEAGFFLGKLGLALLDQFLRGGDGGLTAFHRSVLAGGDGGVALIVGFGRFVFLEQGFVALKIGLGADVGGLGLLFHGHGIVVVMLRGGKTRFGIHDGGLLLADAGGVVELGDRQRRALRFTLGLGAIEASLGLGEADLAIGGIEIDQRLAGFDDGVVLDVNAANGAVNASG